MESITTYLLYFLAFYVGATTTLFVLSLQIPSAAFYARLLSSYL